MSQSNETMADGLSVRALEKVRPVGGPVNWRTTKDKTEMKNSESGQTTGFYNDKNFRNWLGWRNWLYGILIHTMQQSLK